MKKYEIIEHTADIGIKAFGGDLKESFSNAASGMFEIIATGGRKQKAESRKFEIDKKADNLENLLVEWLRELLFLSSTKNIIFEKFDIQELDKKHIKATVSGTDSKNYKLETEIKAVTYHMLEIVRKDDGWQAQVIFDV